MTHTDLSNSELFSLAKMPALIFDKTKFNKIVNQLLTSFHFFVINISQHKLNKSSNK